MPGNPAFGGHPWHHYLGAGSLLDLVFPFLVLVLLMILLAAARWGRHQADALLSRRRTQAASPAVIRPAHAVQPELASDLERETITRRLSHAVGEGRLSLEEGEQRIEAVLRSRHRRELASFVADLPSDARKTSTQLLTSGPLRLGLLAMSAVVVLAAALVQAVAGLWEIWPLAVITLGVSALLPRH